jgi:hypothetical protein
MENFRAVIAAWPSISILASDLGRSYGTVHKWWQRDRIPSSDWGGLLRSAEQHGIANVTPALLIRLAGEAPQP